MEDEGYFELMREFTDGYQLTKSETSGYVLPLKFNQGNILFFMEDNQLNMEIFYNQIKNNPLG